MVWYGRSGWGPCQLAVRFEAALHGAEEAHDVFVRETVAGLLRQTRRDAGGRELRGLAWRMGLAPIG